MNSHEIGQEVPEELNKLIQNKSYEENEIEFSITKQVNIIKPVAKIIVWFNLNPDDIKRIYKGCCTRFALTCDEKLTGQYIYIKLLF